MVRIILKGRTVIKKSLAVVGIALLLMTGTSTTASAVGGQSCVVCW
jgi:hypothetical protein